MSQAEALLNSITETGIGHTHVVPDSDAHFIVDPYTREIINMSVNKTVLMRGDHNSERFTFELSRYVDGHDMSLCNRVIVHFDNVGATIEEIHSDVAYMTDLRINPDNPETVISSWLIRREATQIVGILSFSLQYQCVEDGEVTYEWNTDSYDEIEIRKSKNNSEAAVINYTNVLEQWRSQIFGAGDSVMANISSEGASQVAAVKSESASQQAAIELKGSDTLATIPDDYTEIYNMADEACRTKADSLVCVAEGAAIAIPDASNDHIRGLSVYGNTTQVTTTGKNLLPIHATTRTSNGITYTVYADGRIHVKGVSTANSWLWGGFQQGDARLAYIPAGTYYLSGNPNDNIAGYMNGWYADGTAIPQYNEMGKGKSITFERDAYVYYQIMVAAGKTVDSVIYPQLEVGNEATSWEPYTGGAASPNPDYPQELVSVDNPTVKIYGKNLLPPRTETLVYAGLTYTTNDDGSVSITGTVNAGEDSTCYLVKKESPVTLPQGSYTLSGCTGGSEKSYRILIYTVDWKLITECTDGPVTFTLDKTTDVFMYIWVYRGTTMNKTLYPMICHASLDGGVYEPYIEPQSIAFARTIHGIPVPEGGNYTDKNGQQWICDEVDLERGVYVQRVHSRVFDGVDGESVTLYSERESVYGFALKFTDANMQKTAHPAFCTHFENIVTGVSSANKECFLCGAGSATIYLMISKDRLAEYSVEAFKTWLSENPITVLFQLATPIEISLSAEEIIAYKALKANYPNTTVLNSEGAWTNVEYNADIKLYIAKLNQSTPEIPDIRENIISILAELGVQFGGNDGGNEDVNTAELDKAVLDTMILE